MGPSSICDEAAYPKKRSKKRHKATASTSHTASPSHSAKPSALEPDSHVAASPDVCTHILCSVLDATALEQSRYEEAKKQAEAKQLFDTRLESRNLVLYSNLMNDVPIRSLNGVSLKVLGYVFGDHKQDQHCHKASAKYTHSSIPDC